ncbi:MAG TPA: STAS domain-containing protein [Acidimicrobiales bacterium]
MPSRMEVVVEHSGSPFQLDVATGDEGVLITLSGELDLATAPELWAAIDAALAEGHQRLVLDLSGLGFVDSTGLGVFVRAGKELRASGGGLTLRRPGERVAKLLEITRLEEVFEIE